MLRTKSVVIPAATRKLRGDFILVGALLLTLVGCTNKQLYQVGQSYQKSECEHDALTDVQFKACQGIEAKRYEDYDQEREDVLANP